MTKDHERFITKMHCGLTMDRPIEDKHFISPGSYTFIFKNDVSVTFDFNETERYLDEKHPEKCEYVCRCIDIDTFPDARKLADLLVKEKIRAIDEFFVCTGDYDDPEINLISVDYITFEVYDLTANEYIDIEIPAKIVKDIQIEV